MAFPRRTTRFHSILLAFAVAAGPAVVSRADADSRGGELLKEMSGTWKGRGTARKSSTAAVEPVSCRYEGKLAGDGLTLRVSYVCLGVEFKFESRGSLTFQPDKDSYTVSLTVAGLDRKVEGSGPRNGSEIALNLSGQHPETGETVESRMTMSLSGPSKFVNVLQSTDPKTGRTFKAFAATFRR